MNVSLNVHLHDTSTIGWEQYEGSEAAWVEIHREDGSRVGIAARNPKHLRQVAEAAMAAAVALEERIAAKASEVACVGDDPTCPCRDGLLCHYVNDPVTGTPAAPVAVTA